MGIARDQLLIVRALRSAGIPVIAGLALVRVIGAIVPAAVAVMVGIVVSGLPESPGDTLSSAVTIPLVAFGCVIFAGHLADVVAKPLEFQARARIDGTHRTRILELVDGVASIGPLESGAVQRLVRRTGAEPDHGVTTPADGALAQLRWCTRLVGAAAACVVLARYAWWLIPLLLVPVAVGQYVQTRQYFAAVRALGVAMRQELHADVWRRAATSGAEGKDVRIFGFATWMIDRMQGHIDAGNAPFWRHIARIARRSWMQFALAAGGLTPVYLLVTGDAVHGRTTVAVQTAVLVAGWSLFDSVGSSDQIYQIVGAADVLRAFGELRATLAPARVDAPDTGSESDVRPLPASAAPPTIRFGGVRFAYPGTDRDVLADVDLEIRPGELLAIVGLNGAGKSTLIKLLTGLYRPDHGRITADGVDIADYGWHAWRNLVSAVFQDFVRYHLSARDNVTVGQASMPPDQRAAETAAAKAGLDEILSMLPHGWDTPLARDRTGGVDLSGGQWQQVVLARALYAVSKGARLLVLDEPTAHLDVRTEFQLFRRIAATRGDTSVVLISHRLSTVRAADRIVLLEGGRFTESGTHDQLMERGGSYARLFKIQAERFQHNHEDPITEDVG